MIILHVPGVTPHIAPASSSRESLQLAAEVRGQSEILDSFPVQLTLLTVNMEP